MIFFLDFDRTLLDWDGLIAYMIDVCPPLSADIRIVVALPSGAPERRVVWKKIAELIHRGAFSLTEDDVKRYVYKDAAAFMTRHASDIVMVTSGDPDLQKIKLALAFPNTALKDALFCGGHNHKGVEISSWLSDTRPEAFFVDDAPLQLESVARECPWIHIFEICRGCKTPASRFPFIRDFDELEERIKSV